MIDGKLELSYSADGLKLFAHFAQELNAENVKFLGWKLRKISSLGTRVGSSQTLLREFVDPKLLAKDGCIFCLGG